MMTRKIVKSRLTIAISRYNNKQCGLNVPRTTVGTVGWLPSCSVYIRTGFHDSNFRNSLILTLACQCAVCTTVHSVLV